MEMGPLPDELGFVMQELFGEIEEREVGTMSDRDTFLTLTHSTPGRVLCMVLGALWLSEAGDPDDFSRHIQCERWWVPHAKCPPMGPCGWIHLSCLVFPAPELRLLGVGVRQQRGESNNSVLCPWFYSDPAAYSAECQLPTLSPGHKGSF